MTTPTHILMGMGIAKAFSAMGIVMPDGNTTAIAIVSANIPDIDVVRYGISLTHHKSILHKPMVWAGALLLVTVLTFGKILPIHPGLLAVFAAGIISHFVLDTGNYATGVQWLWPVSGKIYHFFPLAKRPEDAKKRLTVYLGHVAWKVELLVAVCCIGFLLLPLK